MYLDRKFITRSNQRDFFISFRRLLLSPFRLFMRVSLYSIRASSWDGENESCWWDKVIKARRACNSPISHRTFAPTFSSAYRIVQIFIHFFLRLRIIMKNVYLGNFFSQTHFYELRNLFSNSERKRQDFHELCKKKIGRTIFFDWQKNVRLDSQNWDEFPFRCFSNQTEYSAFDFCSTTISRAPNLCCID